MLASLVIADTQASHGSQPVAEWLLDPGLYGGTLAAAEAIAYDDGLVRPSPAPGDPPGLIAGHNVADWHDRIVTIGDRQFVGYYATFRPLPARTNTHAFQEDTEHRSAYVGVAYRERAGQDWGQWNYWNLGQAPMRIAAFEAQPRAFAVEPTSELEDVERGLWLREDPDPGNHWGEDDRDSGHAGISIGVSPDGFLHVAWGMHNDPLRYAQSWCPVVDLGQRTKCVDGALPRDFSSAPTMLRTGFGAKVYQFGGKVKVIGDEEQKVTYVGFHPMGDDFFVTYRHGSSQAGDIWLKRYAGPDQPWQTLGQVTEGHNYRCNDGRDNDGDGVGDAADPGCYVDHNAENPLLPPDWRYSPRKDGEQDPDVQGCAAIPGAKCPPVTGNDPCGGLLEEPEHCILGPSFRGAQYWTLSTDPAHNRIHFALTWTEGKSHVANQLSHVYCQFDPIAKSCTWNTSARKLDVATAATLIPLYNDQAHLVRLLDKYWYDPDQRFGFDQEQLISCTNGLAADSAGRAHLMFLAPDVGYNVWGNPVPWDYGSNEMRQRKYDWNYYYMIQDLESASTVFGPEKLSNLAKVNPRDEDGLPLRWNPCTLPEMTRAQTLTANGDQILAALRPMPHDAWWIWANEPLPDGQWGAGKFYKTQSTSPPPRGNPTQCLDDRGEVYIRRSSDDRGIQPSVLDRTAWALGEVRLLSNWGCLRLESVQTDGPPIPGPNGQSSTPDYVAAGTIASDGYVTTVESPFKT